MMYKYYMYLRKNFQLIKVTKSEETFMKLFFLTVKFLFQELFFMVTSLDKLQIAITFSSFYFLLHPPDSYFMDK